MREILKTDRLILRPIRLDDAKSFSTLGSDWDIASMTGSFPYPLPELSAEFKIMHMQSLKRRTLAYPYVITRNSESNSENGGESCADEMMGIADIFRRDDKVPYELSYWVGKPFWGQGFATEACQALIDEAHMSLGLTHLIAGVFADNPASLKVLHKLGFTSEETYHQYFSMARLERAESVCLKLTFATNPF